MADLNIPVKFEATAAHKTLFYHGQPVPLDNDGEGMIRVPTNESQALLAEVRGAQPGSKVKVTLTVEAPATLQMADFEGQVAQNRTVWADARFFKVTI